MMSERWQNIEGNSVGRKDEWRKDEEGRKD
jgi:hypothetical protein